MSKAKPIRTKIVLLMILALNGMGFLGWWIVKVIAMECVWFGDRFLDHRAPPDRYISAIATQLFIAAVTIVVSIAIYLVGGEILKSIYQRLDKMFPDRKEDQCG